MANENINPEQNNTNENDRKKGLIIKITIAVVALAVVIGGVFFACSKLGGGNDTTGGLTDGDAEYGFETEVVTDESGEAVTDENGEEVTTEVAVKYEKDKKGKTVAYKIDQNGEKVTNAKGEYVTLPVKETTTRQSETANTDNTVTTGKFTTAEPDQPTGTTQKEAQSTKNGTTAYDGAEVVPSTGDSGTPVNFSAEDIAIIENMLEVPYLYLASYENSEGVPINIAAHTAVWMAARDTGDIEDGSGAKTFPAGPIVLDLFKYYGQTVLYFKSQCNTYATGANAPITYNRENDTFVITGYTAKTHEVTITSIEDMGNNNFYKVTGTVSGGTKKKVVAIMQKNKLDPSLGFSVKALKWS